MRRLCFQGVHKAFRPASGRVEVLRNVNLQVAAGEFLCVVGPSGCGKSTLLNLAAGLDAPDHGEVLLGEETVRGPARACGLIFKEAPLFPWLRVRDNVAFALRMAGVPRAERRERAKGLLAQVGLHRFAEAWPHELSGGMKQRAALAAALAMEPEVLLLDEPFAALDEIHRFALNQALLDLWRPEGAAPAAFTAVFVTHSVYEAVFLSQRVLVMGARPGRIVDEVLIDGPAHRTAAFRQSETFTAACARLSESLARAADEPALG